LDKDKKKIEFLTIETHSFLVPSAVYSKYAQRAVTISYAGL